MAASHSFLKRLRLLTYPPAGREAIHWLPSAAFVHRTLVPEEKLARKRSEWLHEQASRLSPFPASHYSWGCWHIRNEERALLFLAFRESLRAFLPEGLVEEDRQLPAYLSLLALPQPDQASWEVLEETQGWSAILRDGSSLMPRAVRAVYAPKEADKREQAYRQFLDSLASVPDAPAPDGTTHRLREAYLERDGSLWVGLDRYREGRLDTSLSCRALGSSDRALRADLRSDETLAPLAGLRRRARSLRLIKLGVVATILLLIAGQLQLTFRQWKISDLEAQMARQEPAVKELQRKDALLNSIQHYNQPPMQPIEWLAALSRDKGVEISFTQYTIQADGSVSLKGFGQTVDELNTFRDQLLEAGVLTEASFEDLETTRSQVNFELIGKRARSIPEPKAKEEES